MGILQTIDSYIRIIVPIFDHLADNIKNLGVRVFNFLHSILYFNVSVFTKKKSDALVGRV
jgi:hypothetical protein